MRAGREFQQVLARWHDAEGHWWLHPDGPPVYSAIQKEQRMMRHKGKRQRSLIKMKSEKLTHHSLNSPIKVRWRRGLARGSSPLGCRALRKQDHMDVQKNNCPKICSSQQEAFYICLQILLMHPWAPSKWITVYIHCLAIWDSCLG